MHQSHALLAELGSYMVSFLQVAAIHLTPEPFAVENDLLTPTFKLKRPQAKKAFLKAIELMYKTLD